MLQKYEQRNRRRKRIRAKISGTAERPRLSIFRSNRFISAQIIDDSAKRTIASISTKDLKEKTLLQRARKAGKELAVAASKNGLKKVAFDRGGYGYAGAVKEFAEGAREGGFEF
jgi:large subunit ribosomal protein L18